MKSNEDEAIVTINGTRVLYFHYNEHKKQLEAYDYEHRIICSFYMKNEQWKEISAGSYADCWDKLVTLFADPLEEEV